MVSMGLSLTFRKMKRKSQKRLPSFRLLNPLNLLISTTYYPPLIVAFTCAMLLRETGSDSWQCLMSS